jgi:two-component system sensor histidine kinase/response regulator
MVILFSILAAISLSIVVGMRMAAFRKLKEQTRLIILQSHEIQKQMQELKEQNERLNHLNQEKQQIISLVSHDLKGPFNRIFALIQLMSLSPDNLDQEQKEYLGKIHQIVADGLSMVRNMIDNQKFEDVGIHLAPESVNLTLLLTPLLNSYRALAEKKKIRILFDAPPQVLLMIDKSYISRVVDNLLSNALKFSFPGTSIFVSIQEDDDFVEIVVRDQGPGIPSEDQNNLFHKYQRLTPRPTAGESSTGLGLYIVKTIVDKMQGDLLYKSEEGKGTSFRVRLKKIS